MRGIGCLRTNCAAQCCCVEFLRFDRPPLRAYARVQGSAWCKSVLHVANEMIGGVKRGWLMDEDFPGVCVELGALGSGAIITEDWLAARMGKGCRETIRRAVERGELPPPVRIMGKSTWTAGAIVRHIEKRLELAAQEVEKREADRQALGRKLAG